MPGQGAGFLPVQGANLLGHGHRCHHSLPRTKVTLRSNQHYRGRARPPHLEDQGNRHFWIQHQPHLCSPSSEPWETSSSIAKEHNGAVPVDQRPERRIARQARSVPHGHTHTVATHSQHTLYLVETSPRVNLEKRKSEGEKVGKTRGGCYEFMGTENKISEQFWKSQNKVILFRVKMGNISLQYLAYI